MHMHENGIEVVENCEVNFTCSIEVHCSRILIISAATMGTYINQGRKSERLKRELKCWVLTDK